MDQPYSEEELTTIVNETKKLTLDNKTHILIHGIKYIFHIFSMISDCIRITFKDLRQLINNNKYCEMEIELQCEDYNTIERQERLIKEIHYKLLEIYPTKKIFFDKITDDIYILSISECNNSTLFPTTKILNKIILESLEKDKDPNIILQEFPSFNNSNNAKVYIPSILNFMNTNQFKNKIKNYINNILQNGYINLQLMERFIFIIPIPKGSTDLDLANYYQKCLQKYIDNKYHFNMKTLYRFSVLIDNKAIIIIDQMHK
jgi:hypothetical protein